MLILTKLPECLANAGYDAIPNYHVVWRFANSYRNNLIRKVRGRWLFNLSDLPAIAQALDCRK